MARGVGLGRGGEVTAATAGSAVTGPAPARGRSGRAVGSSVRPARRKSR